MVPKLDTYFYPWELEQTIADFVTHYNQQRYHESLDNLTPADVYHGRTEEVKSKRQKTKERTLERRRRLNGQAAPDDLSLEWRTLS